MKRPKIKIEGECHGGTTHVYVDGVEQENIYAVTLMLEAGELNKAIFYYHAIDLDVEVEADIIRVEKNVKVVEDKEETDL